MINQFSRTQLIFGSAAMERLSESKVAVVGLNSAGASCAEALARSAVGRLWLLSGDKISREMLSGNIFADEETLGLPLTDVAEKRLLSINDEIIIDKSSLPDSENVPDFSGVDYIVDASFDEALTLLLAKAAQGAGVPIISISDFERALPISDVKFSIADVNKIACASRLAFELRGDGIKKHRVIYPVNQTGDGFLFAAEFEGINACALGLIAAGEVVKHITGVKN